MKIWKFTNAANAILDSLLIKMKKEKHSVKRKMKNKRLIIVMVIMIKTSLYKAAENVIVIMRLT